MARTLDWKSSNDPQDIVHIVVQALVEGKLVALPLETAYHAVASALKPEAVSQLLALQDAKCTLGPALFLRSVHESLDYSTKPSRIAQRMMLRGWPGPLILELEASTSDSLATQLPGNVRELIFKDEKFLPQRVAVHDAIIHAMRLLPGPLVAAPLLDLSGKPVFLGSDVEKGEQARIASRKKWLQENPVAVSTGDHPSDGSQAEAEIGDPIALTVNDGKTHIGDLATTVRVEENRCQVLQPGAVKGENLARLGQFAILIVCTGNTCRSPMAEAMLKKKLQEKMPELFQGDTPSIHVASAGISAYPGGAASPEAITVMKKRGLNLLNHQSNPASERTLRYADLILTMTNSHRFAILDQMPELESKVHLVSGETSDVSDPFGGSESTYAACADQIDGYLDAWIDRLDPSWFAEWL